MAINMHAHMWDEDIDARVEHYRHERITHTVMFCTDDQVEKAMRKYPDFIIGFGEVTYGVPPTRDTIRRFVDRGFRGVKVIGMRRPIDDPSLLDMYEAIAEAGLPILFHTGHLSGKRGTGRKQMEYESVLFMHPSRLDTLARMFPDTPMIGAHLGAPYCEAACSVMWKFPNVYFDMSGGTVKHFTLSKFRMLFTRGAGGGSFATKARTHTWANSRNWSSEPTARALPRCWDSTTTSVDCWACRTRRKSGS